MQCLSTGVQARAGLLLERNCCSCCCSCLVVAQRALDPCRPAEGVARHAGGSMGRAAGSPCCCCKTNESDLPDAENSSPASACGPGRLVCSVVALPSRPLGRPRCFQQAQAGFRLTYDFAASVLPPCAPWWPACHSDPRAISSASCVSVHVDLRRSGTFCCTHATDLANQRLRTSDQETDVSYGPDKERSTRSRAHKSSTAKVS
jgi:hypothetical protein